MKVTFYEHSCFGLTVNKHKFLFDPIVTPNELAKNKVDVSEIEVDFKLITHGHADQVDDVVSIARRTKCIVVENYELVEWLKPKGLEKEHPDNIGGHGHLPFGKIKYVTAIQSSVLPDLTYGGNSGGFVIDFGDLCMYFVGDTTLKRDMQLIPRQIDVNYVFSPIGDNFTMGVKDANTAGEYVKYKSVIGMHHYTFPYILIDEAEAKLKYESAGANLTLTEIGETIEL